MRLFWFVLCTGLFIYYFADRAVKLDSFTVEAIMNNFYHFFAGFITPMALYYLKIDQKLLSNIDLVVFDKDDNYIKNIGVKGEDAGQTSEFGWLATDADLRQLYVAVDGLGKIDVYDMDSGELKFDMGGLGNGPGMWEEDIEGLAVGPWGLIFAMDEAGGNIKVFQGDGTFVTQWGKAGLYDGELASSECIAYDPLNRRIIVADEKNYRVVSFTLDSLGF